jgi:hypothetical protein
VSRIRKLYGERSRVRVSFTTSGEETDRNGVASVVDSWLMVRMGSP